MDWGRFSGEMEQRGFDNFTLHGVVGLRDRGCVADVGSQYIDSANQTNGSLLHICDHDWGRVLDVLVESTVNQIERTFVLRGFPARPNSITVYREDEVKDSPSTSGHTMKELEPSQSPMRSTYQQARPS